MSVIARFPADPNACLFASRTVIALIKHASIKMCVDYQHFNAQTVQNVFPLQQIDQVWPANAFSREIFCLTQSAHRLPSSLSRLPQSSQSAFQTFRGYYVFNVMPVSRCNAFASLQHFIERVLGTLIGLGVLFYIDNIFIYDEIFEQLIKILSIFLKLFAKVGFKSKASKFSLFT